jgi:hypothetical protein
LSFFLNWEAESDGIEESRGEMGEGEVRGILMKVLYTE